MDTYLTLIHTATYRQLQAYRAQLTEQGLAQAGGRLRAALVDQDLAGLDAEAFLEHLVNTKSPQIFAESAIYGDGRDWNLTELALLGGIGIAVPVQIFDDGRHVLPQVHRQPLAGTLLFIPGALLRNDRGSVAADWAAATRGGRIVPESYCVLYERRLLPLLLHANTEAAALGQEALVTLPGLGCGQFAGPFRGAMGEHLKDALLALLGRHAARLPQIRAIYYDPFSECGNERHEFGTLSLRVRPLTQGNDDRPQLCPPPAYAEAGDDFDNCRIYSLVAWDQVSWPGNDFWGGARATDDGVKAAATDVMHALTGLAGHYCTRTHGYQPPAPFRTWEEVVRAKKLRLRVVGRLQIHD